MARSDQLMRHVERAEAELRSMFRLQQSGERSLELVAQALERQASLRGVARLSLRESDLVSQFAYAYIALGDPRRADSLIKETNVTIDWEQGGEFIENGYELIAKGIVRMLGLARKIDEDYLSRVRAMRELTEVDISDQQHSSILDAFNRSVWRRHLLDYLEASGKEMTDEEVLGAYRTYFMPTAEGADFALRILDLSGRMPPPEFKESAITIIMRTTSFERMNTYSRLLIPQDSEAESIDNILEDTSLPGSVKDIIRLGYGIQISAAATDQLLCAPYLPNNYGDVYHFGLGKNNFTYLIAHLEGSYRDHVEICYEGFLKAAAMNQNIQLDVAKLAVRQIEDREFLLGLLTPGYLNSRFKTETVSAFWIPDSSIRGELRRREKEYTDRKRKEYVDAISERLRTLPD